MAKCKKGGCGLGAARNRPWCWYCDREFEEEKVLIQHQRMKHFQCGQCHRKLNSASGLLIHLAQVHKQTIDRVPNALRGHDSLSVEIRGMAGVPVADLQRHRAGLPPVATAAVGDLLAQGDGGSLLPLLAQQKVQMAAQLAESKSQTLGVAVGGIGGLGGGGGGGARAGAGVGVGIVSSPSLEQSAVEPETHASVLPAAYAAAYNPAYYQQYYAAYAQQYQAYYAGYYAGAPAEGPAADDAKE